MTGDRTRAPDSTNGARAASAAGSTSWLSRERLMACSFAIGATCFLIGPFPGYVTLVGESADAITFFIGSIFFTIGGALQSVLAHVERESEGKRRAVWWTAIIQFAGTLLFNVTTWRGLHTALSNPAYNRLVWRPDALGSICFLISGFIAYRASPRAGRLGMRPAKTLQGWWEPAVNLLGCILFGVSAVASYVEPSTRTPVDLSVANLGTALGAVCFLACALATLRTGHTLKSPHWRRLAWLEHTVAREVRAI